MLIGVVKWFDNDKGFGVVDTISEGECFLHVRSFSIKPQSVLPGTLITFNKRLDTKKNRNIAERVRLLKQQNDWPLVLNYLGKPDRLYFQKPDNSRSNIPVSITMQGSAQIYATLSHEQIIIMVTDYFEANYPSLNFIDYCEFIEKSISIHFPPAHGILLAEKIFHHFGNKLDEAMLFTVWQKKKFRYIGRLNAEEYEIPESIIRSYLDDLDNSDLKRVAIFSYGNAIIKDILKDKIVAINNISSDEFVSLHNLLELVSEKDPDLKEYEQLLITTHLDHVRSQVLATTEKFGQIETDTDLKSYINLKALIPDLPGADAKRQIETYIDQLIAERCSPAYAPELWLKGLLPGYPFNLLTDHYLNPSTSEYKKVNILQKLNIEDQLSLFRSQAIQYGWIKTFETFKELIFTDNKLVSHYFHFSEAMFTGDFWKKYRGEELKTAFYKLAEENTTDAEKLELFLKEWTLWLPVDYILTQSANLTFDNIEKILGKSDQGHFKFGVLLGKLAGSELAGLTKLYNLAKHHLDKDLFNHLDQKVFLTVEGSLYFNLWLKGFGKIFPKNYIATYLDHLEEAYQEIDKWIQEGLLTTEQISGIFIDYLSLQEPIQNRHVFLKQYSHVQYLLKFDRNAASKIHQFNNRHYNLITWVLGYENTTFDFDSLKSKFIYFLPEQQIKILRKLFHLKVTGHFDLTISKLMELTRFDADTFQLVKSMSPSIPIDISTELVIQGLYSLEQKGEFLPESELIKIVLNGLKNNKHHRFQIEHYFEKCPGRCSPGKSISKGNITKVNYGEDKFYFAVHFPTGEYKYVWDKWGGREVFEANPFFDQLKEAVKALPGAKWNPTSKHWGVPGQYEEEILKFAETYHLDIDYPGSRLENNVHNIPFIRKDIPTGINFCEGRASNQPDIRFKKEFWWCNGKPCFAKYETIHAPEEWENYTLLDFCLILQLNLDSTNRVGDSIEKGKYYQFISLINRFNRLLEKLYCDGCGEILFPVESSNFAAYNVVRFKCTNQKCNEKNEVYLNHCLNGQCNNIIDSRLSKKCSHGLFICDKCGSCCSHNMLQRRLENLKYTGGFIHANLLYYVEHKLGHLERGEYFCHKCGNLMEEKTYDVFNCNKCNVNYDTREYKFKRPNRPKKPDADIPNG